MPCDLLTIQESACDSGIGKLDGQIALLQAVAQSFVGWLSAISPGTDVSLEAIQERACESGVGKMDNSIDLLQTTAQNLCSMIT